MGIFLGDKPVNVFFNGAAAGLPVQGVFLGGIQVFPTGTAATVPGAPTITFVGADIEFTPPEDDGGSAILSYNVYVNGVFDSNVVVVGDTFFDAPASIGVDDEVEIAAVNAIGEGPRSNVFVAE
jgi:hypothetical protein